MFLLDANVLIEASRTYYSVRIAPTYWAWLADQHLAGNIASVASVRKEIDDGKVGHLTTWAATLPPTFWIQPSQPSIQAMTVITAWTMHPARLYTSAARQAFLREADYFLIAEARAANHTVVTREQSSPAAKKRVLIPDACAGVNVACASPFSVYESLGLQFR